MKKKKKSSLKLQITILFVILIGVFFTVQFSQQRQTTDQHASEGEVTLSPTPSACVAITMKSYTTTACKEGGINTINYNCSDGFKGTLGGAACYGEAQMIAYAKNSCEARSSCKNAPQVDAPSPTYSAQ